MHMLLAVYIFLYSPYYNIISLTRMDSQLLPLKLRLCLCSTRNPGNKGQNVDLEKASNTFTFLRSHYERNMRMY